MQNGTTRGTNESTCMFSCESREPNSFWSMQLAADGVYLIFSICKSASIIRRPPAAASRRGLRAEPRCERHAELFNTLSLIQIQNIALIPFKHSMFSTAKRRLRTGTNFSLSTREIQSRCFPISRCPSIDQYCPFLQQLTISTHTL